MDNEEHLLTPTRRRDKSRRGTQKCVRYGLVCGFEGFGYHFFQYLLVYVG